MKIPTEVKHSRALLEYAIAINATYKAYHVDK
jgi:hypothetical protein